MRIAVVGGGPGGLYFAALASSSIRATRSPCGSATPTTTPSGSAWCSPTRRWVASSMPIRRSTEAMSSEFARWDDIDIHYRGQVITSGGHGFAAMSRKRLLQILHAALPRARRDCCASTPRRRRSASSPPTHDLVVGADGVNSATRATYAADLPADARCPPLQIHVAWDRPRLRRIQVLHRRDAARRHADPRLPVRRDRAARSSSR